MAEESTTTDRRTFLSSTCAAGCCAYAGGEAWGEGPSAWTVGARRASAAITARGHVHPSPLRTLSGRQGVLPDVPPVPRAVLAARVLPVPHLLPGRLVLLDPRTELPVLEPAARHHRHEPTPLGMEVLHGVSAAQLAVGHVQERGASMHAAQGRPARLVRAGIALLAGLAAELDRHPSVPRGAQDDQELLQVGPVVFRVAVGDVRRLLAPRTPALRLGILPRTSP
jgi:hypothetical protein